MKPGKLPIIGAILLALALAPIANSAAQPQPAQAERSPNIVMVFTDDWGYGDLAVFKHLRDVKTPHLDKLSQKGVTTVEHKQPVAYYEGLLACLRQPALVNQWFAVRLRIVPKVILTSTAEERVPAREGWLRMMQLK